MKHGLKFFCAILASLALHVQTGCKTVRDSDLEGTGGGGFVKVDPANRTRLSLNGQPYRFSGTNSYSMLKSKESADRQFAMMKEMGTNVVRIWGFWNGESYALQPSQGVYGENKFKELDYILATAATKGIKVIICLSNYWNDFGGINLLNKWAGLPDEVRPYHDREIWYTNPKTKEAFAKYVTYILNRKNTYNNIAYKDDPTILMWEPINEIRGRMDPSGKTVVDWLTWSSKLIKSIDPNHLVSDGSEGFYMNHPRNAYPWNVSKGHAVTRPDGSVENTPPEGSYFEQICKIPSIDLCSIHSWPYNFLMGPEDKPDDFSADWIDDHLKFMKGKPEYNKPLFVGEFGWQVIRKDKSSPQYLMRKKIFERSYYKDVAAKTIRDDLVGVNFWNMADGSIPQDSMTFDISCPQDTEVCPIIKEFSAKQIR